MIHGRNATLTMEEGDPFAPPPMPSSETITMAVQRLIEDAILGATVYAEQMGNRYTWKFTTQVWHKGRRYSRDVTATIELLIHAPEALVYDFVQAYKELVVKTP